MTSVLKRPHPSVVILMAALILAVLFRHPRISVAILFFGVLMAAGFYIVEKVLSPKEENENSKVPDIFLPLNKLAEQVGAPADELTDMLRSIMNIGHGLLNYLSDNQAVVEILKAYRVYIEQYMDSAASLAKKYRKARTYLSVTSKSMLEEEIVVLGRRLSAGDSSVKKTLEEKRSTLDRYLTIEKSKNSVQGAIAEIEATLKALHAAITAVEVDPNSEAKIREEIQKTISTTGEAIELTFLEVKRGEALLVK